MSREDHQFRLRLPEPLRSQISQAAEDNRRSMTAEIVARLESTFDDQLTRALSDADMRSLLVSVMNEVLDARGIPAKPSED